MKSLFSWSFTLLVTCVTGVTATPVLGDVIYDNITTNAWRLSFFSEDEHADDTTLSTGVGSIIRQVEVGAVRNSAFSGTYTGTMTVRLWSDIGSAPGALLGTARVPISLSDNVPHIFAASFSDIVAPTATIWTGVHFSYITQLGAGIVEGITAPSVGSGSGLRARHYPDNSWGVFNVGNSNPFLRINTVPSPSGVLLLGSMGLLSIRRRRHVPIVR